MNIVSLRFSDINGTLKEVIISEKLFEKANVEGIWFDGSSIEGFARRFESDMRLIPDTLSSYLVNGVKTFFCEVYKAGQPFTGDPRIVLKRLLRKTEEDYKVKLVVAGELEFYLLRNGEAIDTGGYFDVSPRDKANLVKIRIAEKLTEAGIEWSSGHHEVGPGQNEIDILHDYAVNTADKIPLTKNIIKLVCESEGLKAVFMPKPFYGMPGNGMHIHLSLWSGSENIFYDEKGLYKLSDFAKRFIAGIFEHADAITAVANPTVNSYKRLGEFEAPKYVYWGMKNRDALIRIPEFVSKNSARIEYRASDPSANPYLLFTALLVAGLDGVERSLEPPEPIETDIYERGLYKSLSTLPSTLKDALEAFRRDSVVSSALGEAGENLLNLKLREWEEYTCKRITDWEKEKYIDV
ncbi:glutamine synthetase [Candidatus Bathyarchaeota archaeon]|nr:glutamine synthetase [Candidatus Bathyarchaeota archaeon]MBS7613891.1 glutamine synthetase [Candidatus Bathyarchaeota archaeon]MBS7617525.1 glutamine synthetase [Candidatus Bathyarchaeota archaeon]